MTSDAVTSDAATSAASTSAASTSAAATSAAVTGAAAIVTAEPVRGGFPDPSILGLPGCEQIARYGTTALPRSPLSRLLGLDLVDVEPGLVRYELPLTPWLRDRDGRLSSAVVAVVADAALAGSVVSALPPGHARMATVDLSLHHVGGPLDGLVDGADGLVATGRPCGPVRPGLVLAEVEVAARSGRPVARGLAHCLVFPPLDPLPEPPADRIPEPPPDTPDPYRRPLDDAARAVGPLTRLLGIEELPAESGRHACAVPASPWLCPTAPAIQGGVLVMVAQLGAERAAAAALGGCGDVTQVTASFLRMVFPKGGRLTARSTVSRHSRNLATAAVELVDDAGRALVSASVTCYDASAG